MSNLSYSNYAPTPNPITPSAAQSPNAGWNTNPEGSQYASTYSKSTSLLTSKEVFRQIIDATPQQFKIMKILFDKPIRYVGDDEYTFLEKTWNRPSIKASGTAIAGGTQNITMTDASRVAENAVLVYPDNTHGIVTAVSTTTNVVSVKSQTGGTLPAVAANDLFVIENYTIADGMNYQVGYGRMGYVERVNFIQMFQRSRRWTRLEIQKHQNKGVTDYYEQDMALLMESIYQDAFATYINGKKGEFTFTPTGGSGTYYAKCANGIYPQLVEGGALYANSTPATIEVDFKYLAENTNYKNPDAPRFILGTNKMLNKLSTILKDPIRFTPSDKTYDLDLNEYRVGNMRFVPITVELFKRTSYMFPAEFENRLLVLDMEHIQPVCMTGYEPFEMTSIRNVSWEDGGRESYKEWTVSAMISAQVEVVDGHFYINGIGF